MKKDRLILIAVGILIAYLIFRKKKSSEPSIIKLGDKSDAVYGLQYTISSITGLKFNNMGAYDTNTLNAVKYYLEGTNALLDYEKGYVDKKFGEDLYIIQSKVNSQ